MTHQRSKASFEIWLQLVHQNTVRSSWNAWHGLKKRSLAQEPRWRLRRSEWLSREHASQWSWKSVFKGLQIILYSICKPLLTPSSPLSKTNCLVFWQHFRQPLIYYIAIILYVFSIPGWEDRKMSNSANSLYKVSKPLIVLALVMST